MYNILTSRSHLTVGDRVYTASVLPMCEWQTDSDTACAPFMFRQTHICCSPHFVQRCLHYSHGVLYIEPRREMPTYVKGSIICTYVIMLSSNRDYFGRLGRHRERSTITVQFELFVSAQLMALGALGPYRREGSSALPHRTSLRQVHPVLLDMS